MKEIKDVERTDFLSRLPLPITAVSLSLASLGNLLEPYSEGIRLFCGGLAFVLLFAQLWGVTGVWMAFPATEILTFVLALAIYFHFKRRRDALKQKQSAD